MKKELQVEPHEGKRRYQRYEYSSPMNMYRMDYQDQNYYDVDATGPEKNRSYSGSVKWSSPYSSPDGDAKGSYKYGIEYYESAYYQC